MTLQEYRENRKGQRKQAATQLLEMAQAGDKEAVNELLPLVYDEMRRIAHHKLHFERQGHTLDTTALVHEAYFKLINHEEVQWQSSSHFLAVAALAMKRILINYAEQRKAIKRGGNQTRVELKEVEGRSGPMNESLADELLALNQALKKMQQFNERGSRVVEYHFFGGLTWKEIAEVMGLAPITIRRSWYGARLWLQRELAETGLPKFSVERPG